MSEFNIVTEEEEIFLPKRAYMLLLFLSLLFLFTLLVDVRSISTSLFHTPLLFNNKVCQVDYFLDGKWTYSGRNESTNWDICPSTRAFLSYNEDFYHNGVTKTNQISGYGCNESQDLYLEAKFEYNYTKSIEVGCSMWDYKKSVNYISAHFFKKYKVKNLYIHHIGDSIGGLYSVASSCLSEIHNMTDIVHVSYHHDISLRNDVPCANSCKNISILPKRYECSKCNSVTMEVKKFDLFSSELSLNNIPSLTNILVLNTGSWYNEHEFSNITLYHSYENTLILLVSILKSLIRRDIIVLWIALPY